MPGALARRFAQLVFGGRCFLCRGAAGGVLCAECDAELPRLAGPRCPRCALASSHGAICGRCLAAPPAYDATVAALSYEFPADVLVQALKFRGELALAPLLGDLLAAALPDEPAPDFVVPVPLAAARLRARGFNQALEIARPVARQLGLPLVHHVTRCRSTPPQSGLTASERATNLRQAFRSRAPIDARHVLIVDDVITTGETVKQLAMTLHDNGIDKVSAMAVARAGQG